MKRGSIGLSIFLSSMIIWVALIVVFWTKSQAITDQWQTAKQTSQVIQAVVEEPMYQSIQAWQEVLGTQDELPQQIEQVVSDFPVVLLGQEVGKDKTVTVMIQGSVQDYLSICARLQEEYPLLSINLKQVQRKETGEVITFSCSYPINKRKL